MKSSLDTVSRARILTIKSSFLLLPNIFTLGHTEYKLLSLKRLGSAYGFWKSNGSEQHYSPIINLYLPLSCI